MKKTNVIVNKITRILNTKNISLVDGGFIASYGGMVAIGYKGGNRDYMLSVTVEDMEKFLYSGGNVALTLEEIVDGKVLSGWIQVTERLPTENEYRAVCSAHSRKPFLKRLEIAYITDTTEYQFGYYDGYKWLDKHDKEISNVVAWKIHEPFNVQN